eukprot:GHVS01004430.1.p1 GENE.GHVS01004430.1~~GHVS01004430.1.p1  ORF type:complete len:674 (+),score=165.19 GHVS01004430.1:416-2437(+)
MATTARISLPPAPCFSRDFGSAAVPTTQQDEKKKDNSICQEQQQDVPLLPTSGGGCASEAGSQYPRFKTSMCFFHKKGRCMNGDNCRFAHGLSELKRHQSNFLKTIVSKTSTIGSLTSIPPPPFLPRPPSCPPPPPSYASESSAPLLSRPYKIPSAVIQHKDDVLGVGEKDACQQSQGVAAARCMLPLIPSHHDYNNAQVLRLPPFVETNNSSSSMFAAAAGGGFILSGLTTTALPVVGPSVSQHAGDINYTTNAVLSANGAVGCSSSCPMFVVDGSGISSSSTPLELFYYPNTTATTETTSCSCCDGSGGVVGMGSSGSMLSSAAVGYPQHNINFGEESLDCCGDVLCSREVMTARTELVVASESSRVVSPVSGLSYNDNTSGGMCGQQLLTPSVQILHAGGGVTATAAASGMAYGIGNDVDYMHSSSSSMCGREGVCAGSVTQEYGKSEDYDQQQYQYCYDSSTTMKLGATTGVMIQQPSAQFVKGGVGNLPHGWVDRTLAKWSAEEDEFKAGDEWYCLTKREEQAEEEGQTHSMRRTYHSCASSDTDCSDDCCVGEYTCPITMTENRSCGDDVVWRPQVAPRKSQSSPVDPSVVRRTLLSLISDKVEETAPFRCGYYPKIAQRHRAAAEKKATEFNYHAALVCLNQASTTEDFSRLVCSSNVCPWSDNFD